MALRHCAYLFGFLAVLGACSQERNTPFPPPSRGTPVENGLVIGNRLMAAGEYELALKSFSRAAGEIGLTVEVLTAIGSANLGLGRLGQAEKNLRRAIAKDDSFVPAWNNLGVVLIATGQFFEAEQILRRAFELDSGQSEEIRDNLRLALAKQENSSYDSPNTGPKLIQRGTGDFLLTTS